jgi:hypothetical protein
VGPEPVVYRVDPGVAGSARFRHLIIWVIIANLVALVLQWVGWQLQRPRPFGIAIKAGSGGWALPSVPVALLAAVLVGMLYTLVPEGRSQPRQMAGGLGGGAHPGSGAWPWVSRPPPMSSSASPLGWRSRCSPSAGSRRTKPSRVTYRRGRADHLDIGGRRGEAIRQAVKDQLGIDVLAVEPFAQQFSARSTPLRIKVQGDPEDTYVFAKLYARSHLRADRWYKLRSRVDLRPGDVGRGTEGVIVTRFADMYGLDSAYRPGCTRCSQQGRVRCRDGLP